MSAATDQQLDEGFRHHVHAYSGLGYDAMVLAITEYFEGQHWLIHTPEYGGSYKCESPRCPGYPYKPEYLAHPIGTCSLLTEQPRMEFEHAPSQRREGKCQCGESWPCPAGEEPSHV